MRVLICGAGIAGLTLAWCLERRGHEPLVVERAPRLREEGYMIDFFGSGCDAAERLGLLPDLESIHYPIDRLAFVDQAGRERFSVAYRPLRKHLFADRHFNFLRGELEHVLYRRFERRDTIRFGTTVASFEPAGAMHVGLSDGTAVAADLLVGADGVHSHVRQLAFGDAQQCVHPLGYEMAAFLLDDPPASAPRDRFVTLTRPKRQVTTYPVRGGRTATFFLHTSDRTAEGVPSSESPCQALRRIYGDLHWVVPDLLDRCRTARDPLFDAVEQIRMPRWSSGRVALVGDACWCVSPLAGQGASMAVAGAYVLAEELSEPGGIESALARYERRLRPAIERQQRAGERMAKWFVPDTERRLAVRDAITRISAWPPVAAVLRRRMAVETVFAPAGADMKEPART